MQQYTCDVCGEVIKGSRNTYTGPCHLLDEKLRGKAGYTDQENDEVSGRMVTYDLCNKHSNEVHGEAARKFFELKSKFKDKTIKKKSPKRKNGDIETNPLMKIAWI